MKEHFKKYVEIGIGGSLINATMSDKSLAVPKTIALSGLALESTKLLDKKIKF